MLLAHLLLERAGWRVHNMGVDLPVADYARAIEQFRPDALALSFVLSRNINKRLAELSKVRGLPIFVGGRGILNYQGLARRRGLLPLIGPAVTAIPRLLREYQSWKASNRPAVPRA